MADFRTTSLDKAARVRSHKHRTDGKDCITFRVKSIEFTAEDTAVFVFDASFWVGGEIVSAHQIADQRERNHVAHDRMKRRLQRMAQETRFKRDQLPLFTEWSL
jgi:hypothetical protein